MSLPARPVSPVAMQVLMPPSAPAAEEKDECIYYQAPPTLAEHATAPPLPIVPLPPPANAPSTSATSTSATTDTSTADCAICFDSLCSQPAVQIKGCDHAFHETCILDCLSHNPRCPICRVIVGKPHGRCPSGTMSITKCRTTSCPGFPRTKTIQIDYDIPAAAQLSYHENPGTTHDATRRTAYLPNNTAGRELLARLKYAWMHGLVFTVGTSLTTGRHNSVVWTSIHHKTSLSGGPHGFPDANYLDNCNGSLDALNVSKAAHCFPYNNAVKKAVTETLSYVAPQTTSNVFQESLQPYHPPVPQQVIQPLSQMPSSNLPPPKPVPVAQGTSPSGSMTIEFSKQRHCPGYGCQVIEITYRIPSGIQLPYHQNQGVAYFETTRIAYLPKNDEGHALLARLKYAWKHGLIFKVGRSIADNRDNAVVWSGIPHKTSLSGGEHGFPDPNYIGQCNAKLDLMGVPSADHLC